MADDLHPFDDLPAATEVCPHCGEAVVDELLELWGTHEFQVDTCCEARLHDVSEALQADRGLAAQFFSDAGVPGVRRVASSGAGLVADFHPVIRPIAQSTAKAFVRQHHRHCPRPPAGWLFGAGIANGPSLLGVVFVGRPSARRLDTGAVAEVTRLCLDLGLPDALRWNAASLAYGWAAREARRRGYARIVTYLRDDECGISVRAAGWSLEAESRGGSWSRERRPRDSDNTGPKTRWGRLLR